MLKKQEKYNIAVVGATGIVGESLLSILDSRSFPINSIHAVASQKSKGVKVKFGDHLLTVEALDEFDFSNIDIAFFSAGGSISKEYAPKAASQGSIVIDNTSEFRYVDNIPLIVPEVNPYDIDKYKDSCDHVWVEDLVELTPDASRYVTYCGICFITKNN